MTHFVEVVGDADGAFVGPFDSHLAATVWKLKREEDAPQFSYELVADQEYRARVSEFGFIEVVPPTTDFAGAEYAFPGNR